MSGFDDSKYDRINESNRKFKEGNMDCYKVKPSHSFDLQDIQDCAGGNKLRSFNGSLKSDSGKKRRKLRSTDSIYRQIKEECKNEEKDIDVRQRVIKWFVESDRSEDDIERLSNLTSEIKGRRESKNRELVCKRAPKLKGLAEPIPVAPPRRKKTKPHIMNNNQANSLEKNAITESFDVSIDLPDPILSDGMESNRQSFDSELLTEDALRKLSEAIAADDVDDETFNEVTDLPKPLFTEDDSFSPENPKENTMRKPPTKPKPSKNKSTDCNEIENNKQDSVKKPVNKPPVKPKPLMKAKHVSEDEDDVKTPSSTERFKLIVRSHSENSLLKIDNNSTENVSILKETTHNNKNTSENIAERFEVIDPYKPKLSASTNCKIPREKPTIKPKPKILSKDVRITPKIADDSAFQKTNMQKTEQSSTGRADSLLKSDIFKKFLKSSAIHEQLEKLMTKEEIIKTKLNKPANVPSLDFSDLNSDSNEKERENDDKRPATPRPVSVSKSLDLKAKIHIPTFEEFKEMRRKGDIEKNKKLQTYTIEEDDENVETPRSNRKPPLPPTINRKGSRKDTAEDRPPPLPPRTYKEQMSDNHIYEVIGDLDKSDSESDDSAFCGSDKRSFEDMKKISSLENLEQYTNIEKFHMSSKAVSRSTSDVSEMKALEERNKNIREKKNKSNKSDPFSELLYSDTVSKKPDLNSVEDSEDGDSPVKKGLNYLQETGDGKLCIANEQIPTAPPRRRRPSTSFFSTIKSFRNSFKKRRHSSGQYFPNKNSFETVNDAANANLQENSICERNRSHSLISLNSSDDMCKDCGNSASNDNCDSCTRRIMERKEAILEILNTEKSFGEILTILNCEFKVPLKKSRLLTDEQINLIFNNLNQIIDINEKLTKKIEFAVTQGLDEGDENLKDVCIGSIFSKNSALFLAYDAYCNGASQSAILLEQLQNQKVLLKVFLAALQDENESTRRMYLKDYLIQPVQRIMKYPLLLKRVEKRTPSDHPDKLHLQEAYRKIDRILKHINSSSKGSISLRRKSKQSEALRKMLTEIQDMGESKRFEVVLDSLNTTAQQCHLVYSTALSQAFIHESDWIDKVANIKFIKIFGYLIQRNDGKCFLVLVNEEIGRDGIHTLIRSPIDMERLVVTEINNYVEIQDVTENETIAFKALQKEDTENWLRFLREKSLNVGKWRGRRGAIMKLYFD
ncbi:DgyrCDS8652 [Dimorphilus gyrociliatus]|uniref:DgyrCDS8652 n=1 Tax=Dimorphilus gyrociliatus TaxID=2664684 RepID=A0A7I8VUP9_9ANNE|nr:DgyrCDS8652 [Dimorphilus gyrociliatus]